MRKANFEVQRNVNVTLYWQRFSRFVLGLSFLKLKKKVNAVKLRQYLRSFITDLFKIDTFRVYYD